MCPTHWFELRPALRDAVWHEYRSGQETRKDPSWSYLAVTNLAIAEIVFKPNDEAAASAAAIYIIRAQRARFQVISLGGGDPIAHLMPSKALA